MTILEAIQEKRISMYQLAKESGVPYATLNDICNGKTKLEKCSAGTVYHLAQALEIPMEELLRSCFEKRSSFENYKSTICHRVKETGDLDFIVETLENGDIRTYYNRKWYPESLYLLGMLDYLSRENHVPLCSDYDDLRSQKLEKPIYPASILAICAAAKDDTAMKQAEQSAIPEFRRFNIIENEVRNVI